MQNRTDTCQLGFGKNGQVLVKSHEPVLLGRGLWEGLDGFFCARACVLNERLNLHLNLKPGRR